MSRRVLGPFNRVEGDLELSLDTEDGVVSAARVNSPLYRGFEQILEGKAPADALVIVPRICGICSVSQSVAAAAALADAMGVTPPPNGERATNLMLATENLADHLTHFYLFFMPDFARDAYAGAPWFAPAEARFKAVRGSAAADVLPARAQFMHLLGTLAGKWPHTLSVQPGGSARAISATERVRMVSLIRSFRAWLERHLFGDALEAISGIGSEAALWAWFDAKGPERGDFARFLGIARELRLDLLGRCEGAERYLSHGNYVFQGERLFARGVWDGAASTLLDFAHEDVTEDVSHAWMEGGVASHPLAGFTQPDISRASGYSWCKAPRWRGEVVQCGALSRQVVDAHPLARDLVASGGGNVLSRVIGRLLEIARVVPEMERWVLGIEPGEAFCVDGELPDSAHGVGLIEAARGALGHWLVIRKGRIQRYQIIAPTTWNFSPRDARDQPGALEQALAGTPVGESDDMPLAVQHIVRSFDPCMVCTVH
ncbi:MAG: nickel-dependent hydrogenase large subunit [Azoarcus sp.]|jgi:hydrogenase large subunit|nr:nickel-dependent hydrogenase large subunit [Azoarcus sp.]